MAKTSFKKNVESVAPATTAPATVDPIAAEVEQIQGESVTQAVVVHEALPVERAPFADDENIEMEDITLPRLNIVQKVGELSEHYDGGEVIFANDLVLPRPFNLMVLGFSPKRFVEKVEGGGRGRIFDTEQAVVEAGGTLDYNEAQTTEKPLFQRLATALIVIECPEGVDKLNFPHEHNGKNYAVGVWNMKGTGYTHGAKTFFTARKLGACRGPNGYRSIFWSINTKQEKRNSNIYFIPVVKPAAPSTKEFRDWILNDVVGF